MKKTECIAMLLAGGQGSRLHSLTNDIAKPALSFGGKYKIIDFSLSNISNSGIKSVGVLTQYKPFELNAYLGIGSAWDLDTKGGGLYVLPPYVSSDGGNWYSGTANAIFQNINFIDLHSPKYVLIVSGDHIYKMDYKKMIKQHKETKADVTIAVTSTEKEDASRFGIIDIDENNRVIDFEEKPINPKSNLASMGVYIFSWDILKNSLLKDSENINSVHDFGENILPEFLENDRNVYAYKFDGYWKDVGTIESYYDANMELLGKNPPLDIYDKHFKVFSNTPSFPPIRISDGSSLKNSIAGSGSHISGDVSKSIISNNVFIGEGSVITESIILPGAKIFANSRLHNCIVSENSVIRSNSIIGNNEKITVA